jgi:hypothetical protein
VTRVVLVALLAAGATAAAGWWTVPLVAGAWSRLARSYRQPLRSAAVGAALAWALLLGIGAWQGPVDAVARRLGGILGMPGWGFVLLTLLFPALLAAAAAQVARPPVPR